jgi:hypothetical protein
MPRTVDLPIISPKFLAPNARAVSFSHDSDVHLIGNSGVLIYTQTVNIQKYVRVPSQPSPGNCPVRAA